jgi:hypothetical protein
LWKTVPEAKTKMRLALQALLWECGASYASEDDNRKR